MSQAGNKRLAGSAAAVLLAATVAGALTSCGGGGGSSADKGANKTYLSVQAADADGDALHYSWRVTAGSIANRDSKETVWTLPDGPGLHFAYVVVSDGKGGYVEQQYAVGSDALETAAPQRAPVDYIAPAVDPAAGASLRVIATGGAQDFVDPLGAAGAKAGRIVYLPGVRVSLVDVAAPGVEVAAATTDARGQAVLENVVLSGGASYRLECRLGQGGAVRTCSNASTIASVATALNARPQLPATQNLRLFGHAGLADGSVCGIRNRFAELESAATVQLVDRASGAALTNEVRVNAWGDYFLDAAVATNAQLDLRLRCEGLDDVEQVPSDPAGYSSARPIERSHVFANSRPRVAKMVANGPEGNVRGRMIVAVPGSASDALPGAEHFLTFKGLDSRRSSCLYYASFGAAGDCDAQGKPGWTISFDDWKKARQFAPYNAGNSDTQATYINKRDLNLVREMVATRAPRDNGIAFYVCNHPGPDFETRTEIDAAFDAAFAKEKEVACVAMEHTVSPGANGGKPFTKFLTFGPDGALLQSVNLDGRGEKFLPGACVACHGGANYAGGFAASGSPSPFIGSHFLPFDTNNYLFSSRSGLSEEAQSAAFHALNDYVHATELAERPGGTPVTRLIDGWYAAGGDTLDKAYVPPVWQASSERIELYRGVVGTSCRTCHVALEDNFDWDGPATAGATTPTLLSRTSKAAPSPNICGGSADLRRNASMANALISYDRLADDLRASSTLKQAMEDLLGCSAPSADPAYPQR